MGVTSTTPTENPEPIDPALAPRPEPAPVPQPQVQQPAQPQAPQPQKAGGSFQNSKAFLIIPLVLIILVIAGGSYLILNKSSAATTSIPPASTSIAAAGAASTTVSPGGVTGPSTGAHCPCLSKEQIRTMLNDSPASSANARFNVSPMLTKDEYLAEANKTGSSGFGASSYLLDNMTGLWAATYNNSRTMQTTYGSETVPDSVTEVVILFSASSAQSIYNHYIAELHNSSSNVTIPSGSVGGFSFSNLNFSFLGSTTDILVGYRSNYFVLLALSTTNNGVYSGNQIAAAVSSTLG